MVISDHFQKYPDDVIVNRLMKLTSKLPEFIPVFVHE